jgi:hypothetical protein
MQIIAIKFQNFNIHANSMKFDSFKKQKVQLRLWKLKSDDIGLLNKSTMSALLCIIKKVIFNLLLSDFISTTL